jgi:Ni,Fe-hydrogenase maturation factor
VALVEELEEWARTGDRPWLTFDTNYQLNAEDALTASRHDVVIFADASRNQEQGYILRAIRASAAVAFSTHAMSPESVLALCEELYGARPAACMLTLRGYEWEPNGTMTAAARANIQAAKAFLAPLLERPGGGAIPGFPLRFPP